MIWDHVKDLPHAVFVQHRHKALVVFRRADLRIQMMVVNNVVAMHAAGSRSQVWRRIAV